MLSRVFLVGLCQSKKTKQLVGFQAKDFLKVIADIFLFQRIYLAAGLNALDNDNKLPKLHGLIVDNKAQSFAIAFSANVLADDVSAVLMVPRRRIFLESTFS